MQHIVLVFFHFQLRKLSSGQHQQQSVSVSRQLRGAISLVVLLGLTWAFAVFAVGGASVLFHWLFSITNAFQVRKKTQSNKQLLCDYNF